MFVHNDEWQDKQQNDQQDKWQHEEEQQDNHQNNHRDEGDHQDEHQNDMINKTNLSKTNRKMITKTNNQKQNNHQNEEHKQTIAKTISKMKNKMINKSETINRLMSKTNNKTNTKTIMINKPKKNIIVKTISMSKKLSKHVKQIKQAWANKIHAYFLQFSSSLKAPHALRGLVWCLSVSTNLGGINKDLRTTNVRRCNWRWGGPPHWGRGLHNHICKPPPPLGPWIDCP